MNYEILPGPSLAELAEFGGAVPAEVPVEAFHSAAPDPLWRVAPGILEHLENGHMAELTCRCRCGPGHEYRRRQTRRTAGE